MPIIACDAAAAGDFATISKGAGAAIASDAGAMAMIRGGAAAGAVVITLHQRSTNLSPQLPQLHLKKNNLSLSTLSFLIQLCACIRPRGHGMVGFWIGFDAIVHGKSITKLLNSLHQTQGRMIRID